VDKNTNETHYLNPKAWTTRRRWSSHADMIYQYAHCIKDRLHAYNYTNIELYIDVWRSMNHRFNQRQLNPRVDLIRAKWSPFENTEWLLPLLTELSDWRSKMIEIEDELIKQNRDYDLTFVADFPGLQLENFVSPHLNASIEVLNGKVNVEIESSINDEASKSQNDNKTKNRTKKKPQKYNVTLSPGEKMKVKGIIKFRVV
jgi:vitamin K-dependent gamma-carboxylase